jgi:hypothetical protein
MKNFVGFILFIVTQITTPIFNLIGMIYACLCFKSWKEANEYYLDLATSEDQHSNVAMRYLFNHIMIREDGYKFGNKDETVSSVFGKNQKKLKLRWFGYIWGVRFLNIFEKDHSLKSIDETETND